MRIAQIAPLYEAVPPRLYGGTERVVAYLCDALVGLGHDVTLFSSGDAQTEADIVPVRDQAIRLDAAPLKSDLAAHLAMLHEVKRRASQFDVLHFHVDMIHFPLFEAMAAKTVTTIHGRLDLKDLPKVFALWRQYPLVSISHSQRRPIPAANWIATVPHGVPATTYAVAPRPTADYLAFIGRISPEKRPEVAIELAKASGIPLKIAAKVDAVDRRYFEAQIEPLLDDPLIDFIGEIGDADKSEFIGNARALLFPIDWPEPFGLVMIEAFACVTPVIAWDRGSVREVIDHGITGFIVNDAASALAALDAVSALDRHRIRATFDRRFSASTMARNYLGVYTRLLQSRGRHLPVLRTETEEILNDECER